MNVVHEQLENYSYTPFIQVKSQKLERNYILYTPVHYFHYLTVHLCRRNTGSTHSAAGMTQNTRHTNGFDNVCLHDVPLKPVRTVMD